jgi:hypothetical protein
MTRPSIRTELGRELLCPRCGDYWPATPEFFYRRGQGKGWHSYCKACYLERRAELRSGADRKNKERKTTCEKLC